MAVLRRIEDKNENYFKIEKRFEFKKGLTLDRERRDDNEKNWLLIITTADTSRNYRRFTENRQSLGVWRYRSKNDFGGFFFFFSIENSDLHSKPILSFFAVYSMRNIINQTPVGTVSPRSFRDFRPSDDRRIHI